MSLNHSYSLQKRILLNTSVVLVFFIAAMSFILLNTYKAGIRQATFERLYAQFYSLLSVADQLEPGDLFLPEEIPSDKRFNQYGSGISALVYDETESLIWQSLSATYEIEQGKIPLPLSLPGEATLQSISLGEEDFFQFHYIAEWESETGEVSLYHFVVLENKRPFNQVIETYRNTLWMWLAGLAASLILILFVVLRWTLKPIRQAVKELRKVEQGVLDKLSDRYPQEIRLLTHNINRFISNERHQSKRYKETLGNLAHSLKTPLAVMQAALQNEAEKKDLERICGEQLQRMNQIVGYQLQRATSGPQVMMKSMSLKPAIAKLVKGLEKVYAHKGISIQIDMSDGVKVLLNEGDLYEICGNLLDNACKWAKQNVKVSAQQQGLKTIIIIEDDGPGIAEEVRQSVLSRGKRLDESVEGQGIGMSVVKEIVDAYRGDIEIDTSQLGGALVKLTF
ncbi:ATP-binding protein [Kangiella sp.]|uniref:ATP-binding protein n=1 Tax=Kangiella sp. TaxID=1920245 RepID=UPI00199F727C|nr:ATP-binding protein [Kangiella sp.]MBD3652691.1 GHKL domain-containing protein [Kangiella sp.]